MNSDRTVVVASLIWLGVLVALSRQWVGDIRSYITKATHGLGVPKDRAPEPTTTPSTRPRSGFDPNAGAGGGGGGGGGGSW